MVTNWTVRREREKGLKGVMERSDELLGRNEIFRCGVMRKLPHH